MLLIAGLGRDAGAADDTLRAERPQLAAQPPSNALPLAPVVNAPARRYERRAAASDLVRPGLDAGATAAE